MVVRPLLYTGSKSLSLHRFEESALIRIAAEITTRITDEQEQESVRNLFTFYGTAGITRLASARVIGHR